MTSQFLGDKSALLQQHLQYTQDGCVTLYDKADVALLRADLLGFDCPGAVLSFLEFEYFTTFVDLGNVCGAF